MVKNNLIVDAFFVSIFPYIMSNFRSYIYFIIITYREIMQLFSIGLIQLNQDVSVNAHPYVVGLHHNSMSKFLLIKYIISTSFWNSLFYKRVQINSTLMVILCSLTRTMISCHLVGLGQDSIYNRDVEMWRVIRIIWTQ